MRFAPLRRAENPTLRPEGNPRKFLHEEEAPRGLTFNKSPRTLQGMTDKKYYPAHLRPARRTSPTASGKEHIAIRLDCEILDDFRDRAGRAVYVIDATIFTTR